MTVPVQAVVTVVKDTVAGVVAEDERDVEEATLDGEDERLDDEEDTAVDEGATLDDEDERPDDDEETAVDEAATLEDEDETTAGQLMTLLEMSSAVEVRLKYASILRIFSTLSAVGGP